MNMPYIPTAAEMANCLHGIIGQLNQSESFQGRPVITLDNIGRLRSIASKLKGGKNSKDWRYTIESSKPIEFAPTCQEASIQYIPKLTADIAVCSNSSGTPFKSFTLTLEVIDVNKKPITRWHIDKANNGQPGPFFHLQGGGHWAGNSARDQETPIKLPRWSHPPMDIVLAIEMVIANFYPEQWESYYRTSSKWNELIKESQKLCYAFYCEKICSSVHSSILSEVWNY